jgi:carboxyl-terminal processing protease
MKRLRLSRVHRLAIATLISISVILTSWLILPGLPTKGESPSQLFDQVWETINDNFFDPNFNGVDWKAMSSKYKPKVLQAQSREERAALINQMLSELKTSHTRFYTPDEPAYYQVLGIFAPRSSDLRQQLKKIFPQSKIEYSGIGIFTKDINGKTFVSAILEGSPAAEAGLKVGDRLVSVENSPFHPIQSFAGKAGQKVTL